MKPNPILSHRPLFSDTSSHHAIILHLPKCWALWSTFNSSKSRAQIYMLPYVKRFKADLRNIWIWRWRHKIKAVHNECKRKLSWIKSTKERRKTDWDWLSKDPPPPSMHDGGRFFHIQQPKCGSGKRQWHYLQLGHGQFRGPVQVSIT